MDPDPGLEDLEKSPAAHRRSESQVPLLRYYNALASPTLPAVFSASNRPKLSPTTRRVFFVLVFILSTASLAAVGFFTLSAYPTQSESTVPEVAVTSPIVEEPIPSASTPSTSTSTPAQIEDDLAEYPDLEQDVAYSPYVLGPPAARFRDNLRNDTQYITSWISAGWTNDVMTYANLIYLGSITGRVPIIAMFTPSHIGGDAETIGFGQVFDVPRYIRDSGIPIVEWSEVKDPDSAELEDLGCWNIWEAVQYNEHQPRRSVVPPMLGLDISYTKAPTWVKLIPDYEHDQFATFWSLARLGFPEERAKDIGDAQPSPTHHVTLDPDEHVLCYDYLYYVCAQQPFEFERDYNPAWRYVGKYLRWTERIEDLTAVYVRRTLNLPGNAEVPPYIAIHVRHGDFANWCWEAESPEDCFAPLSVIATRVREVQDELRERKGIEIPDSRVIVTSDEQDEAWWDDVRARGWAKVDHDAMHTVEAYGRWYPVLLDAAIQSHALGFVGTDRSTYSVLSFRRVADWWEGAVRMVKWGRKDADAH